MMTPDGRYVAFVSAAHNLVLADTNGIPDVFVRDLQAQATTLVSVGAISTNGTRGGCESPDITTDGRYIAFFSTATNLVPGVPPGGDIYVRDLMLKTTTWGQLLCPNRCAFEQCLLVQSRHQRGWTVRRLQGSIELLPYPFRSTSSQTAPATLCSHG